MPFSYPIPTPNWKQPIISSNLSNAMPLVFGTLKTLKNGFLLLWTSKKKGQMSSFLELSFSSTHYSWQRAEHITKRGNPYARKILFKCIHNIASASHTNPCHIADFYDKRKRQSQVTSTKPHTIASIHRLIRTMYYLITHNKLYDYSLTQNR